MKRNIRFALEVFDALPLYILLFEGHGKLKRANRFFLDAVGLTRKETAGMPLQELECLYSVEGGWKRFFESQWNGAFTFSSRLTDKQGRVFSLKQTLVHVSMAGLDCIVSFGHDITELSTEQLDLAQVIDPTEPEDEASRRKRAAIANLNHQIRTPMNAIIGYAEMLTAFHLGEREQRFVETIRRNGLVLMALLNDILESSNPEEVKKDTELLYRHQSAPEGDERQPVLLVVDDMPVIAGIIQDYFKQQPIEILVAKNSDDCMKLARFRQPDLILMDLNLDEMDGLELTHLLKKDTQTAAIPVVVMTGRLLDKKEYASVFDDFLSKPFHLQELQRVVERFLHLGGTTSCEISQKENKTATDQNQEGIRSVWNRELSVLLQQALVSGSLDAAFHLGKIMYEHGKQSGVEPLMSIGKQLQDDASFPDILRVEALLADLIKYTGEDL